MTWLTVYREAAGWLVFIQLATLAAFITWLHAARPIPREQPPAPVKEPPPPCPWCGSHECLDSTLCNCGEPCGSWICEAKEESRG